MPDLLDYRRSRAVLIGTGSYQDPGFLPLPAAVNSLAGMRRVLTDPELCGWPEDRVTVLQDPVDMRRLVQTLRRLARDTDEALLLYFVGHGVILPRGQLCLVLNDTSPEHADVTGLDYERVREALADSPARVKVAVLDCCYSGRAIEAQSAATDVADSTDTRGVYTLTASDHTAHVVPLDQQTDTTTSFTGTLLELIREGIPSGPERLTLGTLYVHLRRRLDLSGLPAPNQRGTDTADRFPFTRNAAHRPDPPLQEAPEEDEEAVSGQQIPGGRRLPRRAVLLGGIGAAVAVTSAGVLLLRDTLGDQHKPTGHTDKREPFTGHTAEVLTVAFSQDGKTLASGSLDKTARVWNTVTGRLIKTLHHQQAVAAVAFDPRDSNILTSSGPDRYVPLWHLDEFGDQDYAGGIEREAGSYGAVYTLAFSPDGKTLASGGMGDVATPGTVRPEICLWDVPSDSYNARTFTNPTATAVVLAVAFSPDSKTLASGSSDGIVRLWNIATGHSTALPRVADNIDAVAFSPDGKTLASGDTSSTVRLWNVAAKKSISLNGHKDIVHTVAFSPDGKILASGSADKTIRLWDTTADRAIRTITSTGSIRSVAFSPDGKTLASNSGKTIRLWKV
ncbi:MAG TPA: caspase family protein [Streptomyces sp.]